MEIVRVGNQGLTASTLALGCMGMSEFYVGSTKKESEATIAAAIARGITMFDTADMYGPFTNERLVGACVKTRRASVVVATKFGYVRKRDGTRIGLNGHPKYVKRACEDSLRRLRTEYIDLYYLHRVDRRVPIEATIAAMAELVSEGKVRYLGLSEVSAETLRRAHAIFPISAVQNEYSLVSREPETDLFDTLRALSITLIAYAPLGRGLLTGRFRTVHDIPLDDYRCTTPRFAAENLQHNVALVQELEGIAAAIGATPAQLALAWVREKIAPGVTLVGTTRVLRLIEDIESLMIHLTPAHVAALETLFHRGAARGSRYADMSRVNG